MFDVRHNSTGNLFRAKRLQSFLDLAYGIGFMKGSRCRVVDVGGTSEFWWTWRDFVDWSRVEVTCVNIEPQHSRHDFEQVSAEFGDATNLSAIEDNAFDLVYSNSVIEHVGRANFPAFAREVSRVAPAYFVQAPNYWFPIEPHARTAFLHWMPDAFSARLLMHRELGYWPRAATYEDAVRRLRTAELPTRRELADLFPDAKIIPERFVGLVKSWMAVKH